ncbi:PadR family transcriptional regulator [Streptomyces griseus]|uniref:PadR family transcriptional regulator n=1 Tax=Streptomyces griseus TaxID=1911 RepID=UPI00055E9ED6|nr:PadR family transcriptional regulator [Streptomyces griseus]
MSATRLLVLGAVLRFGTAHGYLVRSELVSWGAEEWANVKWGSLYHALRKLAEMGFLDSTTSPDWPGRVDYEITEKGRKEFRTLLRDALRQPAQRQDMLAAGLALLPELPRDEAVALLNERLAALEEQRAQTLERLDLLGKGAEPGTHLRELTVLWAYNADSAIAWTRGLIERLEAGEYHLADEEHTG